MQQIPASVITVSGSDVARDSSCGALRVSWSDALVIWYHDSSCKSSDEGDHFITCAMMSHLEADPYLSIIRTEFGHESLGVPSGFSVPLQHIITEIRDRPIGIFVDFDETQHVARCVMVQICAIERSDGWTWTNGHG